MPGTVPDLSSFELLRAELMDMDALLSDSNAPGLPPPPVSPTAAPSPDAENLARIRSILFGQQVETFEHRFAALETDLSTRLAALERTLADRADALGGRLDTLRDDTTARFHAQQATHDAATDALRSALSDVATTNEAARADLNATHTARADAQDETVRTLSATVDRLTDGLSRDKADRALLAELFDHLAQRLRGSSEAASDV